MAILEVRREGEKPEQLVYSCYTNSKWSGTDIYICVKPSIQARADSNTTVIMQLGTECKLCEVLEAHMCVTKMTHTTGQGKKRVEGDKLYDAIPARSYCVVYKEYSTALAIKHQADNNTTTTYQAYFNQQCLICPIASKQCRDVGKQEVSDVTLLIFRWDDPKQMKDMFTMKRNQGRHDKAT